MANSFNLEEFGQLDREQLKSAARISESAERYDGIIAITNTIAITITITISCALIL